MIKKSFVTNNRKIIRFEIEGKKVVYFDDIWTEGVQIYPNDNKLQHMLTKMKRTGNKNIQFEAALIIDANKGEQLEEYNKCNTEEELKEMIIKDARSKGLIEIV